MSTSIPAMQESIPHVYQHAGVYHTSTSNARVCLSAMHQHTSNAGVYHTVYQQCRSLPYVYGNARVYQQCRSLPVYQQCRSLLHVYTSNAGVYQHVDVRIVHIQ